MEKMLLGGEVHVLTGADCADVSEARQVGGVRTPGRKNSMLG